MKTVRWGLLSTARINRKLIPAIRQAKRSKLAAVASRSLASAKAYGEEWGIPRAFGSYQDMLDSGEVDAVYIGLPNHLHGEWTLRSLEAGIHVLCEKPFAVSLQEVDAVLQASQQNKIRVAEGLMYRHHSQTRLVRDLITRGELGEITAVRGVFTFLMGEGERKPDTLNVRMVPAFGGGSLWDLGIYPLSYTQFLLGCPPRWVFGSQVTGPTGVDEVFTAQMGYSTPTGEVLAQFSCSFNSPYHTAMEIIGKGGQLLVKRPFNNLGKKPEVLISDPQGQVKKLTAARQPLYLGEVEDLEAAILDGEEPLIGLEETRNHILTALALYQSAARAKPVQLEEFRQSNPG